MSESTKHDNEIKRFKRYIEEAYAECGRVFNCLEKAKQFAATKPKARITRLMEGREVRNPADTSSLYPVIDEGKDKMGVPYKYTYWFKRVPNGEYLVSLV